MVLLDAQVTCMARSAQRLVALREASLNPPEWTERVPEAVPLGPAPPPYPDRIGSTRSSVAGSPGPRPTLHGIEPGAPRWDTPPPSWP
jgi:hypothetical protein